MKPRIITQPIEAPYPWRDFRRDEYTATVDGNTFTLPYCVPANGRNYVPRLETTLKQLADDLVEIRIYSPRMEGFQGVYTQHFYVWDGSTWVRRRRDHRDVRMRMMRAAGGGKDKLEKHHA